MAKKTPARRPHRQQRKAAPRPKPTPATVTTAIIRHPSQERTLRPAEIDLLKKTVAKDCTDEEFSLFMLVCKKKKLDPFTKQVYAIKWPRRNQPAEMVIIVGIGGYRSMAARSHRRDFGGTGEPKWTFNDPTLGDNGKTPAGRRIPDSVTVEAFRKKGERVGAATVFWEEFAPVDLRETRADFWNRMPKHMLAKCAESHALRKVFPDLSDIYSEEEMSQRLADLTPGGRQISHDGVAPSGKILDTGYGASKASQQQILDAKKRGEWCERHGCLRIQCPSDEHTQAENDAVFQQQQALKGTTGAKRPDVALQRGQEADSRLAAARNVTPPKRGDSPAQKAQQPAKPKVPHGLPKDATLEIGTIHRVIQGMTRERHVAYVSIRLNGIWHNCWSDTLRKFFPNEVDLVSTVAELWIDNRKDIVGIKRLGSLHFQEDGRTPIRREPGEDE
jgi:phage recombination protein Bet